MKKKEIIRNSMCEIIYNFIIIIHGFIIPILIIISYGSSINGLISSITNSLAYISLLEMGLNNVIKHHLYKPINDNNKDKIESILYSTNKFFKRIAKIFIIYIIVLLIVYPFITQEFNYKFIDLLIILISINTFIDYYFSITYKIFLYTSGKSYLVSIINSIVSIINIIVIYIIIKNNCSILIVKLISSLVLIIKPIIFSLYVNKKYKLNIKNKEKYIIKDKWDGLYQHIAWVIYNKTDILVLTLFSSLSNISIYAVYSAVCIGLRNLVSAITSGIDATFGNMIARNKKDILNDKFNIYETIYFSLITIIFSSAIIMIIPFVKVYTVNIHDANYINYPFGILIILAQFIIAIRMPYRALIHSGGYFKETKNGAIIESILNIVISVMLVFKLGLVGVAIGSLVATLVRTIEFTYFSNKYILKRKIFLSIKKIIIVVIEIILIIFISKYIPYINNINYVNFFINLLITILLASIIVLIINIIFYNNDIQFLLRKNEKN